MNKKKTIESTLTNKKTEQLTVVSTLGYDVVSTTLPKNFFEGLLIKEMDLTDEFTMEKLLDLVGQYSIAIEHYLQSDPMKAKAYKNRMEYLLTNKDTLLRLRRQNLKKSEDNDKIQKLNKSSKEFNQTKQYVKLKQEDIKSLDISKQVNTVLNKGSLKEDEKKNVKLLIDEDIEKQNISWKKKYQKKKKKKLFNSYRSCKSSGSGLYGKKKGLLFSSDKKSVKGNDDIKIRKFFSEDNEEIYVKKESKESNEINKENNINEIIIEKNEEKNENVKENNNNEIIVEKGEEKNENKNDNLKENNNNEIIIEKKENEIIKDNNKEENDKNENIIKEENKIKEEGEIVEDNKVNIENKKMEEGEVGEDNKENKKIEEGKIEEDNKETEIMAELYKEEENENVINEEKKEEGEIKENNNKNEIKENPPAVHRKSIVDEDVTRKIDLDEEISKSIDDQIKSLQNIITNLSARKTIINFANNKDNDNEEDEDSQNDDNSNTNLNKINDNDEKNGIIDSNVDKIPAKFKSTYYQVESLMIEYMNDFNLFYYTDIFEQFSSDLKQLYESKYQKYIEIRNEYHNQIKENEYLLENDENLNEEKKLEIQQTIDSLNEEQQHQIATIEDEFNRKIMDKISEFKLNSFKSNSGIQLLEEQLKLNIYSIINDSFY